MQAQIDDRYSTMDEVRQAAADSATVANNGYFAMDNQISTTTPHKITKLEADVIMLTTQLLDLGDKWNYFATKYSEAKDQLVAAKLHSEQISNLLQEATARLHEAELNKPLTQFHLKLSESAIAYYTKTCDEFKDKLEDVVKTIKATDCPSDTTGDNISTYASVNKIRPGFIIQRNRQDVVKTIKATDCPSDTTGDNNSTYASVNKIRPGFIIQQNRLSLLYYWANDFLFFLFFFLLVTP
jgi:hypothetical protein